MTLSDYLARAAASTDQWLDRLLPAESVEPVDLHRAMRYSVFAGGKRLRPLLCAATGESFGAREQAVMPIACALEMIHTYSLIHDDLPAMDDDDLRRGRPTCHRAFGEALAILAGDALMTHAFLVLAQTAEIGEPVQRVSIIEEVARAAGSVSGMVGGQVVDIQSSAGGLDASALDRLHAAKTGALLTASVVTGGIAGGASADELATLRRFGASIGLAFQIADDILDVTSTAEELGKTPGKDAKGDKLTYPALFGIDESRRRAAALVDEAIRELANLDRPVERLVELARYVVARRR